MEFSVQISLRITSGELSYDQQKKLSDKIYAILSANLSQLSPRDEDFQLQGLEEKFNVGKTNYKQFSFGLNPDFDFIFQKKEKQSHQT